jgi:hypothetical protein
MAEMENSFVGEKQIPSIVVELDEAISPEDIKKSETEDNSVNDDIIPESKENAIIEVDHINQVNEASFP